MNYVLFLGGRVGYEALRITAPRISIRHVFLEKEHAHEHTRFSEAILELCEEHGFSVSQELDERSVLDICETARPDYLMCFGYRRMIREAVCAAAKVACIGSHFAPLPRYRGFAPLNWVLINGEPRTAVNIFFLADQVDAGDIIAREWVEISRQDDINSLTDKCIRALEPALVRALSILETGAPYGEQQDESRATYTCSRNPEDGLIDWHRTSQDIYNLVRALTYPMPGAYTYYNGRRLYVWKCQTVDEVTYEGRVCGKIIAVDKEKQAIKVLTGDGSVWITQASTDPGDPNRNNIEFGSIRVTLGEQHA